MSELAANLTAWTLQSALLLAVGLALPRLLGLQDARVRLAYFYGLLAAVLLLPLAQPESGMPVFSQEISVAVDWIPNAGPAVASWSAPRLLLVVLAAGALARLAWLGIGLDALRRWSRETRPAVLSPEAERLVSRVGVEARLLESGRVKSPVAFGWRRPAILLPAGFSALPPEAQTGIVCHELIHVRRRDWLFALVEEGVRALLWFHPGVWMLLARIALCREQVVDSETVRLTGSRRAYLEALRTVACRSWQPAPMPVPGLPFFHRGHLRERVAHLCKEVSMSRPRIATLVTTSAGLLALTAVLGILVFPMSPLSGTAWAGGKPLKVEGNVQRPKAVTTPAPVYPESAKAAKIEGTAVVETVIDETGHVTQPKIKTSSGDKDLDQAAIDAVSAWTFQPATLDGKPVAVYYTLTLRFALS
jgi:TonB family protein